MTKRQFIETKIVNNDKPKQNKAKKPRISISGYKLADVLPRGQILTDNLGKKWRIGKSIALGGFGEIYLASDKVDSTVKSDASFVAKVEFYSNGTLFTEMHCYHRIGKLDNIKEWIKCKQKRWLGIPPLIASGTHTFNGIRYRFLIIERFKESLDKIMKTNPLSIKSVYTIGIKLLDILEYIHSFGYIHGDVKASNILLKNAEDGELQIYLVDYGLASKYRVQNKHKQNCEDIRRAHTGTIEYTSRDAHIGAISRRSDLEILGYNMLQWLSKTLPWEDNLSDYDYVQSRKNMYMSHITKLINWCFPKGVPRGIGEYLIYVSKLEFEEEPNYDKCRQYLKVGLASLGIIYNDRILLNDSDMECNNDLSKNCPLIRSKLHCKQKFESPPSLTSWEIKSLCLENAQDPLSNPTNAMLKVMQKKQRFNSKG